MSLIRASSPSPRFLCIAKHPRARKSESAILSLKTPCLCREAGRRHIGSATLSIVTRRVPFERGSARDRHLLQVHGGTNFVVSVITGALLAGKILPGPRTLREVKLIGARTALHHDWTASHGLPYPRPRTLADGHLRHLLEPLTAR